MDLKLDSYEKNRAGGAAATAATTATAWHTQPRFNRIQNQER